jgi:putative transposase
VQYAAQAYQEVLRQHGMHGSMSRKGDCWDNGLIERFMRTLKEECIYVHRFRTLEEARWVIGAFIRRYNADWLLERHGYRTPAEVRQAFTRQAA